MGHRLAALLCGACCHVVFAETTSVSIQVTSTFPGRMPIYWDDGKSGVEISTLEPKVPQSFNSFVGHTMFVKDANGVRLDSLTVAPGVMEYLLGQGNALPMHPRATKPGEPPYVAGVRMGGGNQNQGAQNIQVRSLLSVTLAMWWEDPSGERAISSKLKPGEDTTTNSYVGHCFIFANFENHDDRRARVCVEKGKVFYVLYDEDSDKNFPEIAKTTRKLEAFRAEYLERTGRKWNAFWPKGPPRLHMWPADKVGQKHEVATEYGHYSCVPEGNLNDAAVVKGSECHPSHADSQLTVELEVVSTSPRVFVLRNFLSDAEVDHIKATAGPRLTRSSTGQADSSFLSKTRTSSTAWLGRDDSVIIDDLHRRAGDVLKIDEKIIRYDKGGQGENIQVVHYKLGQKYDAHHDWGVDGTPNSRYITLLMYLTDMPGPDAGGETAFPKAADGRGLIVHPGKGGAVLFYNMLEDGNSDDLTLHAALPVNYGEKWLANFWIWDRQTENELKINVDQGSKAYVNLDNTVKSTKKDAEEDSKAPKEAKSANKAATRKKRKKKKKRQKKTEL